MRTALAACLMTMTLTAFAHTQGVEPAQRDETLFVKEQQSFEPGYAVGDIAIGDPAVADFKVLAGRRELLLFGRGPGKTTLTVWDQKNVKRHEVLITVITREDYEREKDLRELLTEFPDIQVRKLGSGLIVSGTVKTVADLETVKRLASAAGAESVARLVRSEAPSTPMPTPTGTTGAGAVGVGRGAQVQYEIELFEASLGYRSGSYATGVEPSGRSLFRGAISTTVGAEQEIYIAGTVARAKGTSAAQAAATGLRLKVRPGDLSGDGQFSTYILVETNLPVGAGPYDPAVWRRARWEFSGLSGEPLGLAGNELLATANVSSGGGSKLGRIVGTVTGLGGIAGAPGMEYGGVVPYFDKDKKTQLLVVLRPRVSAAR